MTGGKKAKGPHGAGLEYVATWPASVSLPPDHEAPDPVEQSAENEAAGPPQRVLAIDRDEHDHRRNARCEAERLDRFRCFRAGGHAIFSGRARASVPIGA